MDSKIEGHHNRRADAANDISNDPVVKTTVE